MWPFNKSNTQKEPLPSKPTQNKCEHQRQARADIIVRVHDFTNADPEVIEKAICDLPNDSISGSAGYSQFNSYYRITVANTESDRLMVCQDCGTPIETKVGDCPEYPAYSTNEIVKKLQQASEKLKRLMDRIHQLNQVHRDVAWAISREEYLSQPNEASKRGKLSAERLKGNDRSES